MSTPVGKYPLRFSAVVWQHSSEGGWHFVSLPESVSKEIRTNFGSEEEGWGRLKAVAAIHELQWETAIWFDTKLKCYLLPLRADVRKQLKIVTGATLDIQLYI